MFGIRARSAKIDEFGIQLANGLAQRVPLEPRVSSAKKREKEKYTKAIDHALALIVAFQRDIKLGVYGKARLFNAFKWELKRLGYSDEFIDDTTATLVNFAAARGAGK
jgi:hypothetical protein